MGTGLMRGDGGERATRSTAERRRELGRRGKEGERAAALGWAGRWGELGRGAGIDLLGRVSGCWATGWKGSRPGCNRFWAGLLWGKEKRWAGGVGVLG